MWHVEVNAPGTQIIIVLFNLKLSCNPKFLVPSAETDLKVISGIKSPSFNYQKSFLKFYSKFVQSFSDPL